MVRRASKSELAHGPRRLVVHPPGDLADPHTSRGGSQHETVQAVHVMERRERDGSLSLAADGQGENSAAAHQEPERPGARHEDAANTTPVAHALEPGEPGSGQRVCVHHTAAAALELDGHAAEPELGLGVKVDVARPGRAHVRPVHQDTAVAPERGEHRPFVRAWERVETKLHNLRRGVIIHLFHRRVRVDRRVLAGASGCENVQTLG